jgi:hypothetical protein
MITRVPGWSWEVAEGGVTLHPIDVGPAAGSIRYRERIAPLRSLDAIVGSHVEAAQVPLERAETETLVTDEGEYAAVVTLRDRARDVQLALGIVFADDWYAEVAGVARHRDHFVRFAEQVRALVRGDRLALGIRRRVAEHAPPPGWLASEPLPQFMTWSAPDGETSITVYPALPTTAALDAGFAAIYVGPPAAAQIVGELVPRTAVQTRDLAGFSWELDVRDAQRRVLARRVILLRDDRYLYVCYLDTPHAKLAAHRPVVDALATSIRPLPRPRQGSDTAAFDHWA